MFAQSILVTFPYNHYKKIAYCSCGWNKEIEVKTGLNLGNSSNDLVDSSSNDTYKVAPIFCESCGNTKFITMYYMNSLIIPTFARVWVNDEKISLSLGTMRYSFNNKAQKLYVRKDNMKLIYNTRTQQTYLFTLGRIRNVSYGSIPFNLMRPFLASEKYNVKMKKEFFNALRDWATKCMTHAGLNHVQPEEFFDEQKLYDFFNLSSFVLFLRFPVLQYLPFRRYEWIRGSFAKFLRTNPTSSEVWKFLCGTNGKIAREYITNEVKLDAFLTLRKMFFDLNNLGKILPYYNTSIRSAPISISEITSSHHDVGDFYLTNDRGYKEEGFEDVQRDPIVDWAMNILYGGDEALMARSLVKHMEVGVKNREGVKVKYKLYNLLNYLQDSRRMYMEIIRDFDPNYHLKFRGDIRSYHDALTADYMRYTHEDRVISYSEEELAMETEISGYKFILPRSTHDLIEIGTVMNHCVGSYGSKVVSKDCTVVLVTHKGAMKFCLDLRPISFYKHKEAKYEVSQCKKHSNQRGTKKELEPVVEWCKRYSIDYTNCYDIMLAICLEEELHHVEEE